MQIPLVDYYQWRSLSSSTYAWDRSYGYEFLRHEKKQVDQALAWSNRIRSANDGHYDSVNLYTVEIPNLRADWRAALAERGDYHVVGLSALMNGLHAPQLAVIPAHARRPDSYRLIRLHQPKRFFIVRGKTVFVDPIVEFEDWEYRPSDEIYLDVPFERRHVAKLLSEGMTGGDMALADQLQAPLLSAPAGASRSGGIGFAAKESKTQFAQQFHLTHQRILPPEYSALLPPASAFKGRALTDDGIKFHVAERLQPTRHHVEPLSQADYGRFVSTLRNRGQTFAEHSIVGTWLTREGSEYRQENSDRVRRLIDNFGATEITLPADLSDLVLGDVDLTRMNRYLVDEDVRLTIANSRQFMPVNAEAATPSSVEDAGKDVRSILAGFGSADDTEAYVRRLAPAVVGHANALALTLARSDGRPRTTDAHEAAGMKYVLENLKGLAGNPTFVRMRKSAARELAPHFIAIKRALSSNGPMQLPDLVKAVELTGLFRDAVSVQTALDKLREQGYLYLDRRRCYVWIGE